MVEIRRVLSDASLPDVIRAVNLALDLVQGNIGGRFEFINDDGVERNIRGGASISTGNFAVKIRSGIGNHLNVRKSDDTAAIMLVKDAGVEIPAGGLYVSGASLRIKGLFSGGHVSTKTLFITDAVNSETVVGAIPSGTGTEGGWVGYNNTTPGSATGAAVMRATSTAVELRADNPSGSGALPLDFYTNAAKRMSLTAGGVLQADLSNATIASRLLIQTSTANNHSFLGLIPNGSGVIASYQAYGGPTPSAAAYIQMAAVGGVDVRIQSEHNGAAYLPLVVYNNGAEQSRWPETGGFRVTAVDPPLHDTQVTPGSQCKAFAYVIAGGGASMGDNYNIASVTRNLAGDFTVTIDRDFATVNYAVVATIQDNGANLIARINGQGVGSFDIHVRDTAGTKTDPDAFAIACYGTLS